MKLKGLFIYNNQDRLVDSWLQYNTTNHGFQISLVVLYILGKYSQILEWPVPLL